MATRITCATISNPATRIRRRVISRVTDGREGGREGGLVIMARSSWRGDEPKQITHAPDGMDRHVRRRIGQAPPQTGDMGFQRVGRHFIVEAVEPFLQY